MRFSTRRFCSVSLCGLPLCGWAVVAPRCFHFTITELTVDPTRAGQKFDELTCWKGGILWRCHVKSLTSSVRPFYCQWLSMKIAWLGAWFYTPVSNGCDWNSRIHSIEEVSTYFCIYSVCIMNWFVYKLHFTSSSKRVTKAVLKQAAQFWYFGSLIGLLTNQISSEKELTWKIWCDWSKVQ